MAPTMRARPEYVALPLASDALLSRKQAALVQKVRAALPECRALAAEIDRAPQPTSAQTVRPFYARLFQLGLHRAAVPRAIGGLGHDAKSRALLLEELARADPGAAMALIATWNALLALDALGGTKLVDRLIRPCLRDRSGSWMLSVASAEPNLGSDVFNFERDTDLTLRARRAASGFTLSGEKWMVSNAGAAAAYVVVCQGTRRGPDGRIYAVVERGAPGLTLVPLNKRGLRGCLNARVIFDAVRVPASHLFEPPRAGAAMRQALARSLAEHAVELAALCIGVGQTAVELAVEHARRRRQAGRLLSDHQVVALRLAEITSGVQSARALAWQAADLTVLGETDFSLSANARAHASIAARAAATTAAELMGSRGLLDGDPIDKVLRDADAMALPVMSGDLMRVLSASSTVDSVLRPG